MKVKVEKQPKSTLKLNITVPVDKVKESYEKVITSVVANAELKGFRKGQAPREMVEEKTDVSKLYGDVINELLKTYYPQALKEQHINPISNPKVEIQDFTLEKNFEFTATVATRPEVKVKDFRKDLAKKYEERKKEVQKINEEKLKQGEKLEPVSAHLHSGEIIEILVAAATVEIPDLLIEEETDRMLSQLVNQVQTLGMSLDQYLKAQDKTAEELRTDYDKISEKNLKAEFVMGKLINDEKIEVSDEEILETAKATGDPKVLENLEKDMVQKWYIKSILQKNKLIAKLIEEVEKDEK